MSQSHRMDLPALRHPGLSWKHLLALWAVLTAAIIPAMLFIIAVEREVSQYSTLTFETYARQALGAADFARAIRICTGALKVGISRSDYWGKAYMLRAQAYACAGKTSEALSDLQTCARCWVRSYYFASEAERNEAAIFGTALGRALLESGDAAAARGAISAAGVASGRPVEYLYEQRAALSEAQRHALWSQAPYIVLEDFEGANPPLIEKAAEEQGRELVASHIEEVASPEPGRCAAFELSAATKPGKSWYGIPLYVPLSERPFAIRAAVKCEPAVEAGVVLAYWFEQAHKSASTSDAPSSDLGDGWKLYDIRRDFFAERAAYAKQVGYDPTGGIISRLSVGLEQGPAVRCWVSQIEIYISNP